MKTTVLYGPEKIRVEEKPVPLLEPDNVLIKVNLCGICGTDLLVYDGRMPVDLPYYNFGHEYIGVVEKVGGNVKNDCCRRQGGCKSQLPLRFVLLL